VKQNIHPFIIAIDGPAATGKGTLARAIAKHYDIPHLDTGLTYRAVAHAMLEQGKPLNDLQQAMKIANDINFSKLDRSVLSAHHIAEAASKISTLPQVRRILVQKQRDFATHVKGAVLDGRDIGTVVCPEASVKIYITAASTIRAKRRFDEEVKRCGIADYQAILEDINRRDERDMTRVDSPLKPAKNAYLLDTSNKSIEIVFLEAVALIDSVIDD
jgi:CMP/dCMP kinase